MALGFKDQNVKYLIFYNGKSPGSYRQSVWVVFVTSLLLDASANDKVEVIF